MSPTPDELAHIAEDLRALAVPVESLTLDPRNAREHDARNVEAIQASLLRFGQRSPIVVQRAGMMVRAGNGRLLAARALGWRWIAAVWVDDGDVEASAYAIADNRTAELATWNQDRLGALLREIEAETGRGVPGFAPGELDRMIAAAVPSNGEHRAEEPPESEPNVPEPPKDPRTKRGDVWRLGEHRLLCGDSFAEADRARLIMEDPVACVLMDPPYAIYGSSTGVSSSIADDKMVRPFFEALGRAIRGALKLWGHAYTCCDWRSFPSIWNAYKSAGLTPKNLLVWDKGDQGLGSSYANCYELVAFHALLHDQRAMTSRRGRVQRQVRAPNIVRYPRVSGDERQHNAAKPVAMLAELIENSTDAGDVVLDLFGGSGSTLMAAERTSRRCLVMEIDPQWCDVIVARWEQATGQKAERAT